MKRIVSVLSLLLAGSVFLSSCGDIIVKSKDDGEDDETKSAKVEDVTTVEETTVEETTAETTAAMTAETTAPETAEAPADSSSGYVPGYMKNGSFVNPWSNIKYTPAAGEVVDSDGEDDEYLHYDMTGYCYDDDGYYEVCLWYRDLEGLEYEAIAEYMLGVWTEDYIIDDDFAARAAGNIYEGYEMYANDYSHGMTILMRECNGYVEMIVIYLEAEMDVDPIFARFSKYN